MSAFTVDIRFDFSLESYELEDEIQRLLDDGMLDHLHLAAVRSLEHQGVNPPAALTVLLTGDEAVRAMNREFRGQDKPTDVLSFPNEFEIPEIGRYLGDVAIAVPTTMAQAASQGGDPWSEFELLTVHGVLHLLGHDHADDAEKTAMWRAQEEIREMIFSEGK